MLKGHKICDQVRAIVSPATPKIFQQALDEGVIGTFMDAGFCVTNPTCGACLGGYMGILGDNEVAVSTTNRNFVGRMGHVKSEVYLASPAVAAASAVAGHVAAPSQI